MGVAFNFIQVRTGIARAPSDSTDKTADNRDAHPRVFAPNGERIKFNLAARKSVGFVALDSAVVPGSTMSQFGKYVIV
jgi:hypothetical protein